MPFPFPKFYGNCLSLSLNQYSIFMDIYYGVNVFVDALGAGADLDVYFIPPVAETNIRCFAAVEINGDHGHLSWTYQLDPGDVTDPGTALIAANRDLESPKLSAMSAYSGPTWDDTGKTFINRGMTSQDGPKGSSNPFTLGQDFFKLNPTKEYVFRLQNRASTPGAFVLNFNWFEFQPQNGLV